MRIDELDLTAPDLIADPYPILADLRAQAPFAWHEPSGMFLAFGYHAANAVLRERQAGRLWHDKEPVERFEPFNTLHRHQMMENEPPEHTRLRGLVAKAFARGHVERLRPRVVEIANELLDQVDGAAGFDLLADYAGPLPVAVIAELLGVPAEDRELLRPWSNAIVKMYEYHRGAEVEDRAITAAREFADYLRALARARRVRPENDLVSHLAAIEDGGARLSEDELVASAILLLNAGHEASVNVLGNGMVALLDQPAERDRLLAHPKLADPAVEEMIRYDAPLHLFERTARMRLTIEGAPVVPGQRMAALLGSANRDPAAFPEPGRFDVGREPNPHLGFGAGIHFCLGAPLARVELQAAVATLLERFPRLELVERPVVRPTFVLRGYQEVKVRAG